MILIAVFGFLVKLNAVVEKNLRNKGKKASEHLSKSPNKCSLLWILLPSMKNNIKKIFLSHEFSSIPLNTMNRDPLLYLYTFTKSHNLNLNTTVVNSSLFSSTVSPFLKAVIISNKWLTLVNPKVLTGEWNSGTDINMSNWAMLLATMFFLIKKFSWIHSLGWDAWCKCM